MKRASRASIIPKIIIFLGTLSVVGIILLFFRSEREVQSARVKPDTDDKLFSEIIRAAEPDILKLWTQGQSFIKSSTQCKEEIIVDKTVGGSYYNCQPHFWQCFWQGGVPGQNPSVKVELFGQIYEVKANPSFEAIPAYSRFSRYYSMTKLSGTGLNLHYGYKIELSVKQIPGLSQTLLLTDTCRDTYLPERIYGYGKRPPSGEGFIWDNFGRRIFIDRFYVTNQMVNEWLVLKNQAEKIISDRTLWPKPSLISIESQKEYCAYFGKRLLSAELADAASMTPTDFKNLRPLKVVRAQTPWQRDHSKTFLGMARINPDYQLTPLDCQLAQVKGCREKYFSTDSASWMGMNYPLGFFQESFVNTIEPSQNLKQSSRLLPASSPWHELGVRTTWDGKVQTIPVAFRCYEEVEI